MSIIKSVQQVAITIAAGATSGTATIASVVTGNSCVEHNGSLNPLANAFSYSILSDVTLTNSTTVTATIGVSDAVNAQVVYATVTEYAAGVLKTNQSGTINLATVLSNTATIASVATANAVVVYQGATTTTPTSIDAVEVSVVLTNATTVTAAGNGSNNCIVIARYTVLEFNSGILASSPQPFNVSLSTAQNSNTATITSVNTAQTKIFSNNFTINGTTSSIGNFIQCIPILALTNGTTVTASRNTEGSTALVVYGTAVQFKAADIKSINRNAITIATSAASGTATIAAVNTKYAAVNMLGYYASASVGNEVTQIIPNLVLTNSTTVTAATETACPTASRTVGWEVIEYAPPSTGNMLSVF